MEHKPETILAAAMKVFGDQGVNVSTAKIAKEAGVSNGTLFNYFPTKQDLIDQLYVSLKQDMADSIGEIDGTLPISSQLRIIWDRWLSWVKSHRDAHLVVNLLHQSGLASTEAQENAMQALAESGRVMAAAQEAGIYVDLPMNYITAIIQSHLDHAVEAELNDQQVDLAYDVLWSAITR